MRLNKQLDSLSFSFSLFLSLSLCCSVAFLCAVRDRNRSQTALGRDTGWLSLTSPLSNQKKTNFCVPISYSGIQIHWGLLRRTSFTHSAQVLVSFCAISFLFERMMLYFCEVCFHMKDRHSHMHKWVPLTIMWTVFLFLPVLYMLLKSPSLQTKDWIQFSPVLQKSCLN